MAVNKVIYGGNTLVDLTGDTVTAADLADGVKATGADGNPIVGIMKKVTIDAQLSTTSTNPVQNKVIKEALDGKLGKNETAARATQDGAGNNIVDTYAKKTDISGMVKSVNGKEPDASGNVNVEEYTHPNSGVTAGTYRSVTVNAQGHVTGGSNPTLAIADGGTGATTASAALSNLGGVPTSEVANSANKIPRYNSNGHLVLPNSNPVTGGAGGSPNGRAGSAGEISLAVSGGTGFALSFNLTNGSYGNGGDSSMSFQPSAGGGSGGYDSSYVNVSPNQSYKVVVGAGGSGNGGASGKSGFVYIAYGGDI